MAKTTINIKADREVKEKAQRVASRLGIPLSTIINAYLNQFVRTKEVHFYLEGEVRLSMKKHLDQLQKEVVKGKNLSPTFQSADEAIRYLNSL